MLKRSIKKDNNRMPQSLAFIYAHLVFSTKNRVDYLKNKEVKDKLFAYIGSILRNNDSTPMVVGGTANHVHILCSISKNHPLSAVIREIKRSSSKWVKDFDSSLSAFQWQNGYAAFSVSKGNLQRVCSYIANQEKHHQRVSFEEELRDILRRQGIEIDERYLWD